MTDADVVREALSVLNGRDFRLNGCVCTPESKCYLHEHYVPAAGKALDRLEALSRVHVTQASHDLLVAEGWLDPEQAQALRDQLADVTRYWNASIDVREVVEGERDRLAAALKEYADPTAWGRVMTHAGRRETVFLVMNDPPWNIARNALERVGGVRGGEEQRT